MIWYAPSARTRRDPKGTSSARNSTMPPAPQPPVMLPQHTLKSVGRARRPRMIRHGIRSNAWLALAALSLFANDGHAQIVTENAGVTSPETPTLREYFSFEETENLLDLRLNHQLLLGIDPKTELRFTLPTIISRRATVTDGFGRTHTAEMAGLGDASLRLKYSLYQVDDVMASTRWAALGELVMPTGDDDRTEGGVRLPRRLQPGAGSWGYGVGTAFTLIRDRHRFSTDLIYRHRTRHEGFRPGPSLHWDLAYWYRITPAEHPPPDKEVTEVRGVIELLNEYRFESAVGDGGANDQGYQLWVAPGIQIYPRRDVLFETSFQIPVVQTIDDELGDRRWRFLVAIKFLF